MDLTQALSLVATAHGSVTASTLDLSTERKYHCITVTLYCSKMNGKITNKKSQLFSTDEIFLLIKKLQNKTGTFYNDRDIWNSICRVERGKVSNKIRFSIYERDRYRCRRCGVTNKFAYLEIDHIIPISKGGKSTYDNLQTLCRKCNYEKGNNRY